MRKTLKSVDDLREQGWKVSIQHFRPTNLRPFAQTREFELMEDEFFKRNGGITVAKIYRKSTTDVPEILFTGQSVCSLNDNFSKKLGLDIAFGRALAEFKDYFGE